MFLWTGVIRRGLCLPQHLLPVSIPPHRFTAVAAVICCNNRPFSNGSSGKKIRPTGVHTTPLLKSMHAAAMRGDSQTAEDLMRKLPRGTGAVSSTELPLDVYNLLLLAYCRRYPAQLDKSFKLINELVEKDNGLPTPNQLSFELAFNAVSKRPNLKTMKKLLKLMADHKVPVTHHSYKCAIAVYARVSPAQPLSATRLVERMVASGLQPCSRIFMHYLMSHVRTNSPWGSREALDAFTDVRRALNKRSRARRDDGSEHPAVDLFPDIKLTWETYSQALLSCGLADMIESNTTSPARVPAWQTASELLSQDLGQSADLPLFPQHVQHAMKACVWAGEKASARKFFDSAVELVATLPPTGDVGDDAKQIDLGLRAK